MDMMRCVECGSLVSTEERYCPHCDFAMGRTISKIETGVRCPFFNGRVCGAGCQYYSCRSVYCNEMEADIESCELAEKHYWKFYDE